MLGFLRLAPLAVGGLIGLAALPLAAQGQPGTKGQSPPSAAERPAPTLPEAQLPQSGSSSPTAPGSMSEQLGQSGGVIRPPQSVDPGIARPTPDPGQRSMPVLPPPGTGGNQPQVEPK